MSALRHLAAIRARLMSSPELVAILAKTPAPDSLPAVYLGNIIDIQEPKYPCIALRQASGMLGVWANRIVDPAQIVIDCLSKKDAFEPSTMEEIVESLLHVQKTLTSGVGACFHEIRKINWDTAFWDSDTGAWRVVTTYLVRVSLS